MQTKSHCGVLGSVFPTFILLVVVCVACSSVCGAQNASGRVVGFVTDSSGAFIAGAEVQVTNVDTGIVSRTTTAEDGGYSVRDLPIGHYFVRVSKQGFASSATTPNEMTINQTLRIDVKLVVGAASTTVSVDARAALVETTNPTIGGTVIGSDVQNLPLDGRNTLDLALTQPGVIQSASYAGRAGDFTVAGGRPDAVGYLLDGGNNNAINSNNVVFNPNPDTVAEFRVLSSNYTAEFARGGGGIISVVTKSGTNSFHGSLFDYLRNEAFNANDFFANLAGLPRTPLKRNQFGGTLGGPVLKNKLFFFLGYQGQRQHTAGLSYPVTVPTPAEANGDFSQSGAGGGPDENVVAFLTANPYYALNAAQGIINPTTIDPVAKAYLTNNLIPTSPSGLLTSSAPATSNFDEYTAKINYYASNKDTIALTLGYSKPTNLVPFSYSNVPGYATTARGKQPFGNITYTRAITPKLLNEARFTAQHYFYGSHYPDNAKTEALTPDVLKIGINSDLPTGPTDMAFDTGLTVGADINGPGFSADTSYTWSDAVTWTRGPHTFKAGFLYGVEQDNSHYAYAPVGTYDLSSSVGSGNTFANFLLALPYDYYQYPNGITNYTTKDYNFFLQDEWRVSRRLSLTYGLRYEYGTPFHELRGQTFNYIQGIQSVVFANAPRGLVFPGDPGAPKGEFFPDKTNFAPRLGFAFDPFGDGKTSIRGGFGMFYDRLRGEAITWNNGVPPFYSASYIYFGGGTAPYTSPSPYFAQPYTSTGTPDPFPSTPPPSSLDFAANGYLPYGQSSVFVNPHLKTPYAYQYNLSIQRQLASGFSAELNYVGNDSHKFLAYVDQNPFPIGDSCRIWNLQTATASNPCPGNFANATTIDNVTDSNYNGLLASLTKRMGDNAYVGKSFFTFAYTYSHFIDNASGWQDLTSTVPYYNHNQFRASSDFDIRQRFVISGGWELPFATLWSSAPSLATTGWTLFPIITLNSGTPLDIYSGLSGNFTQPGPSGAGDIGLIRANQLVNHVSTSSDPQKNGLQYFSQSDFAKPVSSNYPFPTYGTYPRNSITGPKYTNVDLALEKKLPLYADRLETSFRVEAFNLFNHTQFTKVDTKVRHSTFGQVIADASPRIIQLALRITF